MPARLRRRHHRSEDNGGNRDRARTGHARVHRYGHRDARGQRAVARLVLARSNGVSNVEVVPWRRVFRPAGLYCCFSTPVSCARTDFGTLAATLTWVPTRSTTSYFTAKPRSIAASLGVNL